MSALFEELLRVREVEPGFLNPKYEECVDPMTLPDMQKAVARIRLAVERREKAIIYGDYDADGVTASTVLHDTLVLAGVLVENLEIMLPNRFADGYGMSTKVVKRAIETGVKLVMTVDCGSRNHEIVEQLNAQGVDVIITDHHECADTLPQAVAVVNPKRRDLSAYGSELAGSGQSLGARGSDSLDDESAPVLAEVSSQLCGLRDLAGVGVVFKLAQALVQVGMIPEGQEKWLLDLVLIGTVCDSMRLRGENRRLCYYGFKVLEKTRRAGLKELMLAAGVKRLNSEAVGFQVGPRLNAAGRMESADQALQLLLAESRPQAAALALQLENLNKSRKTQQQAAIKEITTRGVEGGAVMVECGDWHEGILGIVAGKLVEQYHRPAIVLAETGEGYKGSGRSFGEFNLAEALTVCKDYIISGGGHAEACGLKVAKDKIADFRRAINAYYDGLQLKNQERFLDVKEDLAVTDFEQLSLELVAELQKLEPYGMGNEEPIFLLPEVRVIEAAKLGADGKHLRLTVWDQNGKSLKLIQFYAPEEYLKLRGGEVINAWITLGENEFRGLRSVEGRIVKLAVL